MPFTELTVMSAKIVNNLSRQNKAYITNGQAMLCYAIVGEKWLNVITWTELPKVPKNSILVLEQERDFRSLHNCRLFCYIVACQLVDHDDFYPGPNVA